MYAMLSLLPTAITHTTRYAARGGIQTRSFLSLPDLSSLSPFAGSSGGNSQDPQTYHERKILPYKQSELYAVVTDVASYPKFLPFCTAVQVYSTSPFTAADGRIGKRMEAEMSYTSDAVASSSTTLFRACPHQHTLSTSSVDPGAQTTTAPQTNQQSDLAPTLVTLDLAFSFSNPLHAAISAAFFGQVSK
ncbi:hypothetical protein BC629DRAFT_1515480 [Irpex lacteus]|nr:hypothetical protein BC629DRAFT_1515480 [Irpex lacteus]